MTDLIGHVKRNADRRERYQWLVKALGMPPKRAAWVSQSVRRLLTELPDTDIPAALIALRQQRPRHVYGPRLPSHVARSIRYQALRKAGADHLDAGHGSQSEGCYAFTMRRLLSAATEPGVP